MDNRRATQISNNSTQGRASQELGSYEVVHKWERKISEEDESSSPSSEEEQDIMKSFQSDPRRLITTIKEDPDEQMVSQISLDLNDTMQDGANMDITNPMDDDSVSRQNLNFDRIDYVTITDGQAS